MNSEIQESLTPSDNVTIQVDNDKNDQHTSIFDELFLSLRNQLDDSKFNDLNGFFLIINDKNEPKIYLKGNILKIGSELAVFLREIRDDINKLLSVGE